jgi:hypothetical protein
MSHNLIQGIHKHYEEKTNMEDGKHPGLHTAPVITQVS